MGLFDRKKPIIDTSLADAQKEITSLRATIQDLKLAVEGQSIRTGAIEKAIKERRRTLAKPLHYKTPSVSGEIDRKDVNHIYYGPGYDLGEIARSIDIEPYINQSVRKHREQILKEGYRISGVEDDMVNYVKKRLFEMCLVSGVTTQQWLRDFTTNLVAYGTGFLVIKRDSERSSGRTIRMWGKDREPIAAVYPLDPTSVSVTLNGHGHPIKWKQRISNPIGDVSELIFDAEDIVVATIDKKPGFVFGTPYILPTLDDVMSLRRLEELAELLAQRNAFPLFHFKVGDDKVPAQIFEDGSSEVDMVKSLVDHMPREGGLVTSNRVEGTVIGGEKQTMDLVPYLEYFEKRVLGGLRLSEVDLGRGSASKASAVTVSQGLEDSARDFQAVISDVLTHFLLLPLCLEGNFDIDPNENLVTWEFTTINREEDRAHQAHGNDLFLSNAINHDELRRDYLKKKPLSEEEKAKLKNEDDHVKAKELAEMAGEQAIAKAKVTKSQAVKNKSANKTRPKNQHGRKSTKTRVTKNSLDLFKEAHFAVQDALLKDTRAGIWDIFDDQKAGWSSDGVFDQATKQDKIKAVFEIFVGQSLIEARKSLDPIMNAGCRDAMMDMDVEGEIGLSKKNIDRFYKNYIEKTTANLTKTAITLIENSNPLSGVDIEKPLVFYINAIFDQVQDELNLLCTKHIDIAYRVGYARTARMHGYNSVILAPDEDGHYCEQCDDVGDKKISLVDRNGSYATLLDTHEDCEFVISLGDK